MGYDSTTISKTVEYYIQEIQLHRDNATCTIFEAVGALSAPGDVNAAGQQYHKPESNVRYDFTVADMVAVGIAPATILSLDNQQQYLRRQSQLHPRRRALRDECLHRPRAAKGVSNEIRR
jgi:hypothetical protein